MTTEIVKSLDRPILVVEKGVSQKACTTDSFLSLQAKIMHVQIPGYHIISNMVIINDRLGFQ